jgi:hypothetical protein
MRPDVEKLLRQDGVHLWGADRKRLEDLCERLDEKETAKLILLGQLEVYHGTIAVPERSDAVICLTDCGILLYGRVWRGTISFHKPWKQLEKFDTSSGKILGIHIALSDGNTRYLFLENYRGKVSERHKDELEKAKQLYFYKDRELENREET